MFIIKQDISDRLLNHIQELRYIGFSVAGDIALHDKPKTPREHYYSIGPVLGEDKEAWFDVRLTTRERHDVVQSMLAEVCADWGISYRKIDSYREIP